MVNRTWCQTVYNSQWTENYTNGSQVRLQHKVHRQYLLYTNALRDFPKTFGLTEIAKGYFKHKFNTDENKNLLDRILQSRTMVTTK